MISDLKVAEVEFITPYTVIARLIVGRGPRPRQGDQLLLVWR